MPPPGVHAHAAEMMSEEDAFANMAELFAARRKGQDFSIHLRRADSPVAIVAPHGGRIEPGTFEIANAIAGEAHNFYCFEALTDGLHVTSHRFDDPLCLNLVGLCGHVVTVHGCKDLPAANGSPDLTVAIGGLDKILGAAIQRELESEKFAIGDTSRFPGQHRQNICNRGRRGVGVQLELSWSLREKLMKSIDPHRLANFASAVARALEKTTRI
jgi:phage replication-related protein YjqB (UPF0714/DUF867 family)